MKQFTMVFSVTDSAEKLAGKINEYLRKNPDAEAISLSMMKETRGLTDVYSALVLFRKSE